MQKNDLLTSLNGAIAGATGYLGLENLLSYANTKAIVFKEYLARASEITEQVFEVARKSTEGVSSGEYYKGIILMTVAGVFAGLTIYQACKKEKKE